MGRFCKTVVRTMFLFHLTYMNPWIKHCGRATSGFLVQVLTSWGVKSIYAGTRFNALCSLNKRFLLFLPSYILGSDWVVLAAAPQKTQPELSAYNFSTKGLHSCKGFLSNEEQRVGKLQVPRNVNCCFFFLKVWDLKFAC